MNIRLVLLSAIFVLCFYSCSQNEATSPRVLLETDSLFSVHSVQQGYREAFLHYADSGAVLLKPGYMPIRGLDHIAAHFKDLGTTRLQLAWVPDFAAISEDGNLGYTYGRYQTVKPDGSLAGEGTYVTIWKRQEDGSWKYVLDTGNEGLSRPYEH